MMTLIIHVQTTPYNISSELTAQSEQQALKDERTSQSEKRPVGNIIPETQQPRKTNCDTKYKTYNNSK